MVGLAVAGALAVAAVTQRAALLAMLSAGKATVLLPAIAQAQAAAASVGSVVSAATSSAATAVPGGAGVLARLDRAGGAAVDVIAAIAVWVWALLVRASVVACAVAAATKSALLYTVLPAVQSSAVATGHAIGTGAAATQAWCTMTLFPALGALAAATMSALATFGAATATALAPVGAALSGRIRRGSRGARRRAQLRMGAAAGPRPRRAGGTRSRGGFCYRPDRPPRPDDARDAQCSVGRRSPRRLALGLQPPCSPRAARPRPRVRRRQPCRGAGGAVRERCCCCRRRRRVWRLDGGVGGTAGIQGEAGDFAQAARQPPDQRPVAGRVKGGARCLDHDEGDGIWPTLGHWPTLAHWGQTVKGK